MVTRWKRGFRREMNRYWDLYLLLVPVVLYFIIFKFWPMYGVQIAFKDFSPSKGIFDSPWVGFKHFLRFFNSFNFWDILRNTITISFYQLIAGFPIPILLALVLNEMRNAKFKKLLQTVTYAPHFLSTVVLVGMLTAFLNPSTGLVNRVIEMLGGEAINFMAEESWFSSLYVWSGVWQNAGWGTIIYMASLSSIDVQLYEAATIDGASRFKKLLHVTLPSIVPNAVTMLILDCGRIMNIGFEKAFLMQNDLNINRSEVISTYVYQVGITQAQYSYSTAVDLFNAVINVILLLVVNKISKKLTQTSLW